MNAIPDEVAERARALAPVVWLIGKVQSGKTSIVRTLTQATEAEIGNGFAACTRTSRVFDFPGDAPIIRFLDTRGIGEVGYDPEPDLAFCEQRAHLLIAVAKAADMEQRAVLDVLGTVRKRHPDWPLVVAQTSLHELYPSGAPHLLPYPFGGAATAAYGDLDRALEHQRGLFSNLPGRTAPRFVPIDFTLPSDGIAPADYGKDALVEALIDAAPSAVAAVLSTLPAAGHSKAEAVKSYILGFALAAGASDAVPVAGAAAVPAMQAAMLHQLAEKFDTKWDRKAMLEFAGALGAGTLIKVASVFGIRQLVKLIPFYGQTVGAAASAAASFATTFAMGRAAAYYLSRRNRSVAAEEISRVYREALAEAFAFSRKHPVTSASAPEPGSAKP